MAWTSERTSYPILSRVKRRLAALRRRSYGLDGLDRKLAAYVPRRPGFFVEAGANDGVKQSNTLYLEKYRGWSGLLVEPVPELAVQCRRNRPRCIVEACALVREGYPSDHVLMHTCDLMSVVDGMLSEDEQRRHLERGAKLQNVEVSKRSVPAHTLSQVLDRHGIERVDLLSLDVEGGELEVLRGLDFARHRPQLLMVEVWDRPVCDAFLAPYYRARAELSSYENRQDVLYELR